MKIIVTGASGFIGSHLTKIMRENNINAIGVSRKIGPYVNKLLATYEDIINYKDIDIVVHLADLNVNNNYVNKKFFDIYSLSSYFHKKIIYVSSGLIYGEHSTDLLIEKSLVNPVSSYAKNKFQNENIVLSNNGTVLRLSNVYGKRMSKNNVFYDIFKQVKHNKKIIKLKNINHIRDFIAVEDVCTAIVNVVLNQKKGIYNISTGKGTSIGDLAKIIIKHFGNKNIEYSLLSKSKNNSKLILDPSLANKIYNWKAKIDINLGCRNLLM